MSLMDPTYIVVNGLIYRAEDLGTIAADKFASDNGRVYAEHITHDEDMKILICDRKNDKIKRRIDIKPNIPNLVHYDKDERSIMLYLECCATDHGGLCEGIRMNEKDHELIKQFKEKGWIEFFGRIPMKIMEVPSFVTKSHTHFVILTDLGWKAAQAFRRMRSEQRGPKATAMMKHLKEKEKDHE